MLLPYLTRALGPAGFGDLSLYQVISALVIIAISLNQDGAISRYYYVYGTRAIWLVNSVGILYSTFVFFIGCLFSLLFKSEILFVCLMCAYTQSLMTNMLTIKQMQKKVKDYLTIQIVNSILSVSLTIILFEFFSSTAIGRMYAISSANLVAVVFSFILIYDRVGISLYFSRISWPKMKLYFFYIFGFGFPLIIHNLSLFSKGQLDRVFVYKVYSEAQLGLYAAAFQLASILAILLMAANKALLPYYYEGLKNKTIHFSLVKKWVLLSFVFVPIPASIAYVIPDSIYVFFLGESFLGAKIYAAIFFLGIAMTFPYFIAVNYLFYYGKTFFVSMCTLVTSLIHVVLILTIGQKSLESMAFILLITNTFTFLAVFYFCFRLNEQESSFSKIGGGY